MDIFIARQPILDLKRRLFAYEVLYRDSESNAYAAEDGDQATSSVLAHSIVNLGLERIVGPTTAFINFTAKHLLGQAPLQLPPDSIVVEILESVPASPEVIRSCQVLKERGYTLALDDFFFAEGWQELIRLADIIKVDIQEPSVAIDLATTVRRIQEQGPVRLLAEKVETYRQFRQAVDLGFTLFQGYFFSRPEVLRKRGLHATHLTLLELLAEVSRAEIDLLKVAALIEHDVSLSYKLLRYINSAYYALVSRIESIRHALSYLGCEGARQFTALVAVTDLAADKPGELIHTAMIRAHLCRSLAEIQGLDASTYFLLGLFSLLDAMLDAPMHELVSRLPLDPMLKEALVGGCSNTPALYLETVIAYERGQWQACMEGLDRIGISQPQMSVAYFDALFWVRQLLMER